MRADSCTCESAVSEAVRTGRWTENLRAHVRSCAVCVEALQVAEWMAATARTAIRDEPLLDPDYIWLRAEIARRIGDTSTGSRRRELAAVGTGVVLGFAAALTSLAVWPTLSVAVLTARAWVLATLTDASAVDLAALGTAWLGLPLLLVAIYLLALRPLR